MFTNLHRCHMQGMEISKRFPNRRSIQYRRGETQLDFPIAHAPQPPPPPHSHLSWTEVPPVAHNTTKFIVCHNAFGSLKEFSSKFYVDTQVIGGVWGFAASLKCTIYVGQ